MEKTVLIVQMKSDVHGEFGSLASGGHRASVAEEGTEAGPSSTSEVAREPGLTSRKRYSPTDPALVSPAAIRSSSLGSPLCQCSLVANNLSSGGCFPVPPTPADSSAGAQHIASLPASSVQIEAFHPAVSIFLFSKTPVC